VKIVNAATGRAPAKKPPTRTALRIRAALEKLPDGHYTTTLQLARELGVSSSAITEVVRLGQLDEYQAPSPDHWRGFAFANKKTAKYMREQQS